MKKYVVLFVMLIFALPVSVIADEVTAYKQGWYDGYRKAYRDAFVDFVNNMQEYNQIISAVLNYKKFLTEMGINAYPVYTYSVSKLADGTIEVQRSVVIKPVTEDIVQAEFLKKFYEEALQRTKIKTGFWVFVKTNELSKEDIGMYEFIAEEKGLKPVRFGEILIFSIEDRKAQADRIAGILNTYGIYPEVAYVKVK
jgi:hypothetical protein